MSNHDVVKILALYLPQFHRTKENDEWWGEGFTEWTAARNAKPLFEGHDQPHLPLDDNFYDLTNPDALRWQAKLMHRYGIDGMCIYHYFFKDGRKILEKPAEVLLANKDIDMPFCFCWANETWARSWSNIRGAANTWMQTDAYRKADAASDNGILIEQSYGDKELWKRHFDYLLPFFQDRRYIRIDGKPVLMIYLPSDIACLRDMVTFWREQAEFAGLPGIYLMASNANAEILSYLDEGVILEPQNVYRSFINRYDNDKNISHYLSYDEVWQRILLDSISDEKVSLSGFPRYDDSPRRGYNSIVLYDGTAKKFEQYLLKLLSRADFIGSSFVFLNAWNEWGEGAFLEPDKKDGYSYLEAVRKAKEAFYAKKENRMMDSDDLYDDDFMLRKQAQILNQRNARNRSWFQLTDSMLRLLEEKISLSNYLKGKGYERVAIYGLGVIGKHLECILSKQGMVPAFAIDQSGNVLSHHFPVITLKDAPLEADLIIVTVTYDYPNICKSIRRVYSCPVVSLSELLDRALLQGR